MMNPYLDIGSAHSQFLRKISIARLAAPLGLENLFTHVKGNAEKRLRWGEFFPSTRHHHPHHNSDLPVTNLPLPRFKDRL